MASSAQRIIVIGAASVALAAAGILPSYVFAAAGVRSANAPSGFRGRPGEGRIGTVAAVDGSSITLSAKNGSTYTVDTQDAKIIKAGSAATLAAVAVGDPIAVIGPLSGDAIAARAVIDGPRERAWRPGGVIGGTIAAVAPGAFTLVPKSHPGKPARRALTIDVAADTVITKMGQAVPMSALAAGAEAIVSGTRGADGALLASRVILRRP